MNNNAQNKDVAYVTGYVSDMNMTSAEKHGILRAILVPAIFGIETQDLLTDRVNPLL